MGLSSLNLPNFFWNLFRSSPCRDSHCKYIWLRKHFVSVYSETTAWSLPWLSCAGKYQRHYLLFVLSVPLVILQNSAPFSWVIFSQAEESQIINFAFWRSYFKPLSICVPLLFLSVSSLWPFQTGDWNCMWHLGDEQRTNTFTSLSYCL